MKLTANRYHDICAGHRVVGHESKCRHLHGHNYRIHFFCEAENGLDKVGRVIDFSVIKEKLCNWLEEYWDHKFLAWDEDPLMSKLNYFMEMHEHDPRVTVTKDDFSSYMDSIVWLDFNPTAENLANFLLTKIGPQQLHGTGVKLVKVVIDETRKCSVTQEL